MELMKADNREPQVSGKQSYFWPAVSILVIFLMVSTQVWAQAQLYYDLTDGPNSIDWRDGQTNVSSVTETYSYNETTDTLTVTATFNASDSLAPLPPMMALAKEYGFTIQFDQTVVSTSSHSTLGPLKGVQNTNTYTYHITGLGQYVLGSQALGSGQVPGWIQQKLEDQVDALISAGHLSAWLVLSEVPGGDDWRAEVYWHYPGETLYFLSETAPLLSGTRLDQLKTYLQTERQTYPPETLVSIPFAAGTRREYCGPTDTLLNDWQNDDLAFRTTGNPRIWNLYGLARYYELMQQTPTSQVMTDCTNLVNTRMQYRHWPTLYWLNGHAPHYNAVHGVNQIFAGLIGYIRLARMAGDTDAENLGWGLLGRMAVLRFAMGKYTQYEYDYGYFQIGDTQDPEWYVKQEAWTWIGDLVTWNWTQPIDNVRQVHWLDDTQVMTWEWCSVGFFSGDDGQKTMPPPPGYGENRPHWGQGTAYLLPFCDMVPELGKFMKDYLVPEANEFCARVVENQPHWYGAYPEAILGQEIGFNVPGDSYGQFIARAWVLDEDPATLTSYLDVPWLPKGDLFYVHKLAETIKAYRNAGTPDTTPPTPDPLTWATAPHSTGDSSISMTATTASDPSGVEYYFECTAGGGHNSSWQTSSTYQDTGLQPNTQYTYRAKARDKSQNYNETAWSTPLSATTDAADTTAPTPDPMTWAVVPYSTGTSSISMTATTASDPAGVEYYFECTAGGGHNSSWQATTTYNDTGLDPNTQYTYRVTARDLSSNHNQTSWSTSQSATTDPSGGGIPGLLAHWKFDETSGTTAADSSGNGYTGTLNGSPQWITGQLGGAISLDGVDDYVDGFNVNLGGVWSITVWAKPLASPEFQGLLGTAGGGNYVQLQSNRLHYHGTYNNYTAFTQDLDWHHFALTRSASGDINVYIDGTPAGSYNDPDDTFTISEIGRFWGNSSYTYEGSVDDLRFYDRVLTQSEVQAVMTGAGGGDNDPPTPDPLTWATVPYSTGTTSISMTATTASDPSGVEYYFECTAGGGNDSGWQDGTTYEDTGLSPSTQYTYRARARDKSVNQNIAGWSTAESATTNASDTTPPTPDPLTWATVPYSTGTSSISMTATTASDPSGVEYYFECTAGGGNDSGWQDSTTYEDTGLSPSTQYTYRVQARDKSSNQNAAGWSTSESATTDSVDTGLLAHWKFDEGSGTTVADSSGNGYTGTLSGSPQWITGQLAGAISLDGVDDYMDGFSVNLDGVWSVTAWARPLAQPEFQGFLGASSGNYIELQSNRFHYEGAGHNYTYFTEDLNWHHFAITRASSGDIVVYIDGSPAGTYNDTDTTFTVSQVGRFWNNSSYTYQGSVDDLRLYNRVLSQTEIQAIMTGGGGGGDTTPPTPDPLTWATVPYATGTTSISMTATTASDPSGVEYYFDCTAGGGNDSGWQDSTTYEDTGLSPSTQYTYRVQARDKSTNQNAGGWSTAESATTDTPPDTTAPTPDPLTWATVPFSTGTTSISMTATTASDPSGVEYYFDCTAGGGNDSGWQDSTTYEDTGLSPSTQYTYRVQARDKSTNQNAGSWSTSESATTDTPPDTTPPTPDPLTWASVPASTGTTSISMTATTASDPAGVEYFFDCTAGAGHDSGWQDSTAYEDTGLDPNTQYSYRVQARDKSANQNAGSWSTTQSATTDAGGAVTLLQDGFETNFDKWTDGGTTDWDRATDQKYSGSYSAHAGSADNDLISDNLDAGGYSSITISFWYRDDDIDDNDDIYLQLYDGSNYVNRFELGNSTEDTWNYYEETINNSGGDAVYFISNFRIKFEGSSIDNGENLWIDDVLITAQGTGADPNLVAWWKFDETSGTTATDSSGNGKTATLYGSPTWTTGHVDGGLSLDGVDDYVSGFSVDLGGVWSVAVWAKPLASPEFQGLLGASSGGNYVQLQSYRIHYRGTYNNYTSFTQDLDWHHFALTRSASGDINVYIDGVPAGNYNDPDTTFTVNEIGRFWGSSSYTYEGSVDDLRLYNRVLTSTEVQALAAQ